MRKVVSMISDRVKSPPSKPLYNTPSRASAAAMARKGLLPGRNWAMRQAVPALAMRLDARPGAAPVDQRGLAGARGAHHGQETSLGQRVHHDIDLLLAAEEQVFLFLAKRSQPRVGFIERRRSWLIGGLGAVRRPAQSIHRPFREAIQAVDQVGLLKRQEEFLIVGGRASRWVLGERACHADRVSS
jgi:hypothetical protein